MLRPMKNADRRPLPVRIFLFVVLRLLFFPDVLGGKSAEERGEIVRNELIKHGLETQN